MLGVDFLLDCVDSSATTNFPCHWPWVDNKSCISSSLYNCKICPLFWGGGGKQLGAVGTEAVAGGARATYHGGFDKAVYRKDTFGGGWCQCWWMVWRWKKGGGVGGQWWLSKQCNRWTRCGESSASAVHAVCARWCILSPQTSPNTQSNGWYPFIMYRRHYHSANSFLGAVCIEHWGGGDTFSKLIVCYLLSW